MLLIISLSILAYFIGSLSSAVIVCRLLHLPDPRQAGSGNPGATNVLRIGGKLAGGLTLLGDVLKGVIPVCLALFIDPRPICVGPVMVAVFLGHLYPVFFKFQGGKGVATFVGILFALSGISGLLFVAVWIIVAAIFRFSSLASLVAALSAPIFVAAFLNWQYALPVLIMVVFIFFRHRANIKRLLAGQESKLNFSKLKSS